MWRVSLQLELTHPFSRVLVLRYWSELFRYVGLELVRGLTKSGALITFGLDRLQAEKWLLVVIHFHLPPGYNRQNQGGAVLTIVIDLLMSLHGSR